MGYLRHNFWIAKSDVPAANASSAASLTCQTCRNMGKLKEMEIRIKTLEAEISYPTNQWFMDMHASKHGKNRFWLIPKCAICGFQHSKWGFKQWRIDVGSFKNCGLNCCTTFAHVKTQMFKRHLPIWFQPTSYLSKVCFNSQNFQFFGSLLSTHKPSINIYKPSMFLMQPHINLLSTIDGAQKELWFGVGSGGSELSCWCSSENKKDITVVYWISVGDVVCM